MKVKAFFPILNVARLVVMEMTKDQRLLVGLEIDGEIVLKNFCRIFNDEKHNNKLYITFGGTDYYLDWFTVV